jgi:hypothetical protein
MQQMSEQTTDDAAAQLAALQQQLAQMQAEAEARIIRAELRAEAVRAGMIDLDGLKLIDTAALKLSASGEVDGAAALMRELRRSKPWLFAPASSSSTAAAPRTEPPQPKTAMQMSEEEWRAARAELLRRR